MKPSRKKGSRWWVGVWYIYSGDVIELGEIWVVRYLNFGIMMIRVEIFALIHLHVGVLLIRELFNCIKPANNFCKISEICQNICEFIFPSPVFKKNGSYIGAHTRSLKNEDMIPCRIAWAKAWEVGEMIAMLQAMKITWWLRRRVSCEGER